MELSHLRGNQNQEAEMSPRFENGYKITYRCAGMAPEFHGLYTGIALGDGKASSRSSMVMFIPVIFG